MNDIWLSIIAFTSGLFIYYVCKFAIAVKRRIQTNGDRERIRLAMRPNESELKASQDWYANESMKVYSKPKRRMQ